MTKKWQLHDKKTLVQHACLLLANCMTAGQQLRRHNQYFFTQGLQAAVTAAHYRAEDHLKGPGNSFIRNLLYP